MNTASLYPPKVSASPPNPPSLKVEGKEIPLVEYRWFISGRSEEKELIPSPNLLPMSSVLKIQRLT